MIGRSNQTVLVLDDHQRVAGVAKTIEHRDQSASVVGMQADRRFVQNIERVDEARAQSLGHHHPAQLATGKGAGRPVERKVIEARPGPGNQAASGPAR